MGFKFAERNIVTINIEDKDYKVHYDQELWDKIKEIGNKFIEVGKNINDDEPKSLELACNTIKEEIDTILGKGASKEIFAGRKQDCWECIDVFKYIQDELTKYKDKKLASYASKTIPQKFNKKKKHR